MPDDVKILLMYNAFKKWVDGASFPGTPDSLEQLPRWTDPDEISLMNEPERNTTMAQNDLLDTEMERRNRERSIALREAAQPIVEFMNKQCTPHDIIVIQQGSVELYSGALAFPTPIPD